MEQKKEQDITTNSAEDEKSEEKRKKRILISCVLGFIAVSACVVCLSGALKPFEGFPLHTGQDTTVVEYYNNHFNLDVSNHSVMPALNANFSAMHALNASHAE